MKLWQFSEWSATRAMSAPGAYDIDIEADDINVIDTATVIWEIA